MAVSQSSGRQRQVTEKVPPSRWECPKCGVTVRTLVPTHIPWCSNIKHRRDIVVMVEVAR